MPSLIFSENYKQKIKMSPAAAVVIALEGLPRFLLLSYPLTFFILWTISAGWQLDIFLFLPENRFSYFSQRKGFEIWCKLSLMKKICMKCQSQFSGKKIRKIFQDVIRMYPACSVISELELINLPCAEASASSNLRQSALPNCAAMKTGVSLWTEQAHISALWCKRSLTMST